MCKCRESYLNRGDQVVQEGRLDQQDLGDPQVLEFHCGPSCPSQTKEC